MGLSAATLRPSSENDIFERLIELGHLRSDQGSIALQESLKQKKSVYEMICQMGFMKADVLRDTLAYLYKLPTFREYLGGVNGEIIRTLPKDFCENKTLAALNVSENRVFLALMDPEDITVLDQVRAYFPKALEFCLYLGTPREIQEIIQAHHSGTLPLSLEQGDAIGLVDSIIQQGVLEKASDIHFEPQENHIQIRFRQDGILRLIRTLPLHQWQELSVRLKIQSEMDISETRRPQHGRQTLQIMGRTVDFRVSTHPTIHGESIVIRILDKLHSLIPLHELGFSKGNLGALNRLMNEPYGLTIMAGPTGAGKTTTLYSMLQMLSTPQVNIMTLEEPVEYHIPGIRQSEIRDLPGRDYSDGIRSILRQDPDILLVGEIRDANAAQMSMRAALTGHQVFTTLHAHDVFGILPRLRDLGLTYDMIADVLKGCVSQRLIRLLCQSCKKEKDTDDFDMPIYVPYGCDRCQGTGFKGRAALSEVLCIDDGLQDLIMQGHTGSIFRTHARQNGFISMHEEGRDKISLGLTSPCELERVLGKSWNDR